MQRIITNLYDRHYVSNVMQVIWKKNHFKKVKYNFKTAVIMLVTGFHYNCYPVSHSSLGGKSHNRETHCFISGNFQCPKWEILNILVHSSSRLFIDISVRAIFIKMTEQHK